MISKKARRSSRKRMAQRNSWGRSNYSPRHSSMPNLTGMAEASMGILTALLAAVGMRRRSTGRSS